MQDMPQAGLLRMEKVHTSENPADTLTKYLPAYVLNHHLDALGLRSLTFNMDTERKVEISQVYAYYSRIPEKTWTRLTNL